MRLAVARSSCPFQVRTAEPALTARLRPSATFLMMEPGASLSGYKAIAVATVSNETGQTSHFDFASAFAEDLKAALRSKGYDISDYKASPPDVLIVQCSIMNYVPGNTS